MTEAGDTRLYGVISGKSGKDRLYVDLQESKMREFPNITRHDGNCLINPFQAMIDMTIYVLVRNEADQPD